MGPIDYMPLPEPKLINNYLTICIARSQLVNQYLALDVMTHG